MGKLVLIVRKIHIQRDERQDDDRGDHPPAQEKPDSPVTM
jgi:hypothetical protein